MTARPVPPNPGGRGGRGGSMGDHAIGGPVKKLALGWAGTVLAFAAAGCVAGIFVGDPTTSERVGSGVLAAIAAASAWRCWNLASGHTKPRPPRTPTPERRPREH